MTARLRLRLTIALGAILSVPAVQTYLHGSIPIDSAAIRVGVAMGLAAIAVGAVASLLNAYEPKPATAEPDTFEDADLVDDTAVTTPDEPPL